jgi:hypothetical protein
MKIPGGLEPGFHSIDDGAFVPEEIDSLYYDYLRKGKEACYQYPTRTDLPVIKPCS